LKAIAIDARFRGIRGPEPLIAECNPWLVLGNAELAAQVLALESRHEEPVTEEVLAALRSGRQGKRFTPVSDHLHDSLRDPVRNVITNDADYTETFDHLEVLLGALATDVQRQVTASGGYVHGPWFGSFTWRDRYSEPKVEEQMLKTLQEEKEQWPPLDAGLFGKSVARAEEAFADFIGGAARARNQRWG